MPVAFYWLKFVKGIYFADFVSIFGIRAICFIFENILK
jgi:hypothetical protein